MGYERGRPCVAGDTSTLLGAVGSIERTGGPFPGRWRYIGAVASGIDRPVEPADPGCHGSAKPAPIGISVIRSAAAPLALSAISAPTPCATINTDMFAFCLDMRPHSPRHPGFVNLKGVSPEEIAFPWSRRKNPKSTILP